MEPSTTPAVGLTTDYTEGHGVDNTSPERHLWLAVIAQAAADLVHGDLRIRADAIAFFRGDDLLRVTGFAGIDRADAPWLRSRALELAEVSPAQRQRNGRLISYQGQTRSLTEWAEISGINATTLCHRLRHNWSIERALTTPGRRSTA